MIFLFSKKFSSKLVLFSLIFSLVYPFFTIQTYAAPVDVAGFSFENAVKRGNITDPATFSSTPYTADTGIAANLNIASLLSVGGFTTFAWNQGSAGSGDSAPSFSNSWDSGSGTKYWMIQFSTSLYGSLTLSSKQRSSNTGPRDFKVQYSTGGILWTDVPSANITVGNDFTTGVLNNLSLPSVLNNKPTVYLRWIMSSNTSASAGVIGTAGTNRIDDILIQGQLIDTTPPVITRTGSGIINIEVGSIYTDAGATWTDNIDGSGSLIATGGPVTTSSTGTFLLAYNRTDAAGNVATQVTRIVNVVDTTPPVITLTGSGTINVLKNSAYSDLGATWIDNLDGTGSLVGSGSVNTSATGSYIITYNKTDISGNAATQVTRTVNVIAGNIPIITRTGSGIITLEVGATYSDQGAIANDTEDGNITGSIVTGGFPISTTGTGSYTVTYNVVDASGNAATQVTRTINVVDTTIPVITLNGSGSITQEALQSYSDAGATWIDNLDGTGSLIGSGSVNVNINIPAVYPIYFNFTDASGNPALQVIRNVTITNPICNPGRELETATGGVVSCEVCQEGYYNNLSGGTCVPAPIGYYVPNQEATEAIACSAGTFTDSVGNNTCTTCPSGYTSGTGATSCNDIEIPVITLSGSGVVTLEIGDSYTDAGATWTDNAIGSMTGALIATGGPVVTTGTGSFTLTYNYTDAAGNSAIQVSRTVNVVDTTAPIITRTGTGIVNVVLNSTYIDQGASCSDNLDITCIVSSSGTVNTGTVGGYTITYSAIDVSGNIATPVTRIVNVISGNAPVITITGSGSVTQEVGSSYTDNGATASDIEDGIITSSIVTVNSVNTAIVGTYNVTYNVSDSSGNPATQIIRTVNIVDTTPPLITRTGNGTVNVEVGGTYTDAGANWIDNYDGTGSIVASGGPVTTTGTGTFTLTYNYTDVAGNPATQITRTVNVVDTTPPLITRTGSGTITIVKNAIYTDPGSTANDNLDQNITSKIVVVNPVNTAIPGNYTITYNVIDSSGNTALQVNRTVQVVDSMDDTDGDGVPDIVEVEQGTDPNSINDYLDTDGDSLSDYVDVDDDGDGSIDTIESVAPNNGDFNGDGIKDILQKKVATIRSSVIGQYVALDTTGGGTGTCGSTSFSMLTESTLSVQDTFEDYPLGLAKFRLECTTPGDTSSIKIYLDKLYDTSNWKYRKYNEISQIYTDISPLVTYTTETVGGNIVTVMNYSITDGGIYDEDGIANGVIIDPSGPAIENRGSSGKVVYDRCEGDDISGSIYDGSCGDSQEIIPEIEESQQENPVEDIPDAGTISVVENEISQQYTLENNFDNCPIVGDIQNGNYLYQPSGVFVDENDSMYKDEILKFKAIGIVDGYADGTFGPKNEITRAEFLKVALISHCYSYKNLEGITDYSDVASATWQARVIEKAESLGMINGDSDAAGNKVFRPNDIITKAEAVKILMRISMIQAQEPEELGYSDIDVDWHIPYVRTGQTLGIFNPEIDNSLFHPEGGVKREYMVHLIQELVELYK